MDLKPKELHKKSTKNFKLLALITLFFIIIISYFLLKPSHKIHIKHTKNILTLPETDEETEADQTNFDLTSDTPADQIEDEWQIITPKKGDTLASIFKRLGLNRQVLHNILQKNPHAKSLTSIKVGQRIQVLIQDQTLEKLLIPINVTQSILVYRDGTHYQTEIQAKETSSQNQYLTSTVRGSLYSTAKRANIPYKIIQQMIDIFHWQIDFARDVKTGDQFTIVYKAFYVENKQINTGEILAVSYKNQDKVFQAVRFNNGHGGYDYFAPDGSSLRKAFTRYPVKFTHISSTFSLSRMHPILHRRRPHRGIDLAAPLGTPIRAVGDGKITHIGRKNGYGNMIEIDHYQPFSTLYGHMLKFQKGLSLGSRIKRGQIIGYVGQSGLATGPHCHFEFHIHHQARNPSTIDLPKAPSVAGRAITAFKAHAGSLIAQMKLYEDAQLATSNKKNIDTA